MTNCSHKVPFESPCPDCVAEALGDVVPSKAHPLERQVRTALGRFNDPARDVVEIVIGLVERLEGIGA